MSIHDPVSNMLTSIRNGQMANKILIKIPFSKLKVNIAKVLFQEGYLENYSVVDVIKKNIVLYLKYFHGKPVIEKIKRISKPSLRQYHKKKDLPYIMEGLGIIIVTTSRGVMTDKKARNLGLGGEILCSVE
ncbi:30S ribosomal protein S8 [Buchnera aphidicola]|uniref:Small ribosomal subunit protein uS8 n=1 Tax=Buchnera aphidicola subsp. Tuberolachnus salignus TaxID=98804 RepID=A0A160SW52_BUCTT|nr:30S ribosomal protein S8 [Buchnera aphidicola]CUR53307.1 30S ribosomal protein S8 [Buchnera aphidicola (Tuberolachnus salignus)]